MYTYIQIHACIHTYIDTHAHTLGATACDIIWIITCISWVCIYRDNRLYYASKNKCGTSDDLLQQAVGKRQINVFIMLRETSVAPLMTCCSRQYVKDR